MHKGPCCTTRKTQPAWREIKRDYSKPHPVEPLPNETGHATCPTCESEISRDLLVVDLNRNVVSFRDQAWRAVPQVVVVAHVLAKKWPHAADYPDLHMALWGAGEGPKGAHGTIKVYISRIRSMLRGTGVMITPGTRAGTYVLVLPQGCSPAVGKDDAVRKD